MASVLRGTGDMKTPGYALVATAALQIPLTGALTLGWFGLPGARHPRAGDRRRSISFTLAALWMLSRLIGPKAHAAPALAARRFPLGRRSATS